VLLQRIENQRITGVLLPTLLHHSSPSQRQSPDGDLSRINQQEKKIKTMLLRLASWCIWSLVLVIKQVYHVILNPTCSTKVLLQLEKTLRKKLLAS